jgi:hypothetical protein
MGTYNTDPIPDSIFIIPSYCQSTCPATTACGKFQMKNLLVEEKI